MKDYPDLPIRPPKEALEIISKSSSSRAQKLLLSSLITQSRSFLYDFASGDEELLILDVTHFLNHRVNTRLVDAIGLELAEMIAPFTPDLILTAPSSGNIPAFSTSLHLEHMPDVVYAPKGMPITMREVYQARSRSYTHGKTVDLTVAQDCLPEGARVAVCDDFLDTGKTALDLVEIITLARAEPVVFFYCIEKPFSGREKLISAGFSDDQILSLIKIESMREGKLKIAGFDCWFELART